MGVWYGILPKVFNMSVTGSIVILAVLAIRFLLRKAPRIFSYMLWGVVLLRLLCPFSLSSAFSVLNLVNAPVTNSGEVEYLSVEMSSLGDTADAASMSEGDERMNPAPLQGAGRGSVSGVISILTCIWLLGIAVLAGFSILAVIRLYRQTACSMRIRENIYLADNIPSPFVLGLLRPRIYLPSSLDEGEWQYIILHEQCHIRRRDYLIKQLAFACLCLHWFNPMVWLAFALAGKDMEMSCDEAVLREMSSDIRAEYAASLLRISTGRRMFAGAPPAFGEGNPKSRIKYVMNYKKPTFWVGLAAATCCAVGAVILLTNPAADRKEAEQEGQLPAEAADEENGGSEKSGQGQMEAASQKEETEDEEERLPIEEAILAHNASRYGDEYDLACCSFWELKSVTAPSADGDGRETVACYGWALYEEFRISEEGIEDVGGSHIPVALEFEREGDEYVLTEYWEPRDGSYFESDVREKFSSDIAEDGIDSQKFVLWQIQDCYAQAVAYGNLDTDAIIGRLLQDICSEPLASSNPQDYIDAHSLKYRELCYYGKYTIQYCQECLRSGTETGLEGKIMERVCAEIDRVRKISVPILPGTSEVWDGDRT